MNWLKYSGVWMGIVLNPFHWEICFTGVEPDDLNPRRWGAFASLGPLWVRVIIDDGTW
jgi:hypothetical protein